jgi:hypothetical protein
MIGTIGLAAEMLGRRYLCGRVFAIFRVIQTGLERDDNRPMLFGCSSRAWLPSRSYQSSKGERSAEGSKSCSEILVEGESIKACQESELVVHNNNAGKLLTMTLQLHRGLLDSPCYLTEESSLRDFGLRLVDLEIKGRATPRRTGCERGIGENTS